MQDLTDDEVFVRSLREPELFEEVVRRYQGPFIRKAQGMLKDEDDAYDAVQEAFVRIYSAAKKYRIQQNASFRAWAYKILVNQCLTMYQKKRRDLSRLSNVDIEEIGEMPSERELEIYEDKLTKEYVMALVSRLPALLARTVSRHYLEDVSQAEMAIEEGVSPSAIRVRLHRAKKELRAIALNNV
jgi:RNA polymerase sigma factor (sigma-70 family)